MVFTVAELDVVVVDLSVAPELEYVPPVYKPHPDELPTKLPPV